LSPPFVVLLLGHEVPHSEFDKIENGYIILLDGKEGVNHSDYRRDEPTERSEKYHRYQNGDTKDHKILHTPQPNI
jgi:hypothetical protein